MECAELFISAFKNKSAANWGFGSQFKSPAVLLTSVVLKQRTAGEDLCELVLRGRRRGKVNQRRVRTGNRRRLGLCFLVLYGEYFWYLSRI